MWHVRVVAALIRLLQPMQSVRVSSNQPTLKTCCATFVDAKRENVVVCSVLTFACRTGTGKGTGGSLVRSEVLPRLVDTVDVQLHILTPGISNICRGLYQTPCGQCGLRNGACLRCELSQFFPSSSTSWWHAGEGYRARTKELGQTKLGESVPAGDE